MRVISLAATDSFYDTRDEKDSHLGTAPGSPTRYVIANVYHAKTRRPAAKVWEIRAPIHDVHWVHHADTQLITNSMLGNFAC